MSITLKIVIFLAVFIADFMVGFFVISKAIQDGKRKQALIMGTWLLVALIFFTVILFGVA